MGLLKVQTVDLRIMTMEEYSTLLRSSISFYIDIKYLAPLQHSWLIYVGRGLLERVPGRLSIYITWPTQANSSNLRGASLQVLTLLEETTFISWCLRRPFLLEGRRGPWRFVECQACLGYGPALRPTLKRSCTVLVRFVWRILLINKLAKAVWCGCKGGQAIASGSLDWFTPQASGGRLPRL